MSENRGTSSVKSTDVSQASGLSATCRPGVRVRVLIPLTLAMVGVMAGFALSLYILGRDEITEESSEMLQGVPSAFQSELDRDAMMMGDTLDAIAANERLRSAFLTGDRELLQERAAPLFEELLERHRITHFYFLDSDRVCFLRVHQPKRHSDKIGRFTAIEAEKTGKLSHGIELGPLGTFTLRVIRPWHEDGRLIGYIELGEEIEHITGHLRGMFGVEFYIAIHKRFLDRTAWEEGMAMLGREADWDRFAASAIASQTLPGMPENIGEYLAKGEHHYEAAEVEMRVAGRPFRAGFHELRDAGGREVGDMVMLRDVTSAYAALSKKVVAGTLICLVGGAGLFVFFYVFLGRVDATLARQTATLAAANEQLKTEIRGRESTEQELRGARDQLRTTLEGIAEAFMVIDRDHRIVMANKDVRDLAGGVDPVAAGLRCHQVARYRDTPCEGEADPCPLEQVLATKQPVRLTHNHYNADGEAREMEILASPIFDKAGEVVQMIESCRDITDRKRAEEELRATMEELERFNRVAVGREERMIELKHEVNEFAHKAGIAPPYDPPALVEAARGEPEDG